MNRTEYFELVGAIADRWPAGMWSESLVAAWWHEFEKYELEYGVRAVRRLQREGHGPFAPDPGLVLRYLRAASPGGGLYPVGRHAREFAEMSETVASPERVSEVVSACKRILSEGTRVQALNAAENGAEGPQATSG